MNRFDDEDKIISQFQRVNDNEVMFATQSETIEAVYLSIHTEKSLLTPSVRIRRLIGRNESPQEQKCVCLSKNF